MACAHALDLSVSGWGWKRGFVDREVGKLVKSGGGGGRGGVFMVFGGEVVGEQVGFGEGGGRSGRRSFWG